MIDLTGDSNRFLVSLSTSWFLDRSRCDVPVLKVHSPEFLPIHARFYFSRLSIDMDSLVFRPTDVIRYFTCRNNKRPSSLMSV